jgi:hypothetical protein
MAETNPKIGNFLVYAASKRIPPETYAPIISRMIVDQKKEDTGAPTQ